jgi:sulfur carrier protein
MKLTVGGNLKEYKEGVTVNELIEVEGVRTPMYVTVSVNDEFIENGDFAATVLRENDTVEFLYFMGGGL